MQIMLISVDEADEWVCLQSKDCATTCRSLRSRQQLSRTRHFLFGVVLRARSLFPLLVPVR